MELQIQKSNFQQEIFKIQQSVFKVKKYTFGMQKYTFENKQILHWKHRRLFQT